MYLEQYGLRMDLLKQMASSDTKGVARKGVKENPFYDATIEVKDYITPILHLQIGLGNDIFCHLLDWIDRDVEKISSDEQLTRDTLAAMDDIIGAKVLERTDFDSSDAGQALKSTQGHVKRLHEKIQQQPTDPQTDAKKAEFHADLNDARTKLKAQEAARKKLADDILKLRMRKKKNLEKLREYRKARKRTENGIEHAINKIVHLYKIVREAYHGGAFNGVCIRRLMADATKIIDLIKDLLLTESKGHVSNETIAKVCDDHAKLLTCLDGAFSALRKEDPTFADIEKAKQLVLKSMERWRAMGLSVTPKAHVLEVHSVSQLLRLAEFGGLFDFLEDFVELSHQEGARLARQYASMPSFEQRSKAMHRAEQVKTDPLVQKRQSEMEAI